MTTLDDWIFKLPILEDFKTWAEGRARWFRWTNTLLWPPTMESDLKLAVLRNTIFNGSSQVIDLFSDLVILLFTFIIFSVKENNQWNVITQTLWSEDSIGYSGQVQQSACIVQRVEPYRGLLQSPAFYPSLGLPVFQTCSESCRNTAHLLRDLTKMAVYGQICSIRRPVATLIRISFWTALPNESWVQN